MFNTVFNCIADFVNTLNSVYGKCVLLGPYFKTDNFNISCFSYYTSVCESTSFLCHLTFLIIFYMSLIGNRFCCRGRFEFCWRNFGFLFRRLFLNSVHFCCTIIWLNINLFNFLLQLADLSMQLRNFLNI
jgi:hypothetical protein